MAIYSAPPDFRTFPQDKPTLLVSWWCTIFAVVVILFRVCGRYIRTEKLFREDWLAFACLIPICIRMGIVHVILLYGTNNTMTEGLSEVQISQRVLGSKLVLASRILYAASLWMLKLTISEFFKRLTLQIWKRSYEITLQFIRWFLLITFIAVLIADVSECQPITHYWQVVPDPGPKCRQGYAQLLTMGIANVFTDLLLVLFPIPIIIRSQMITKRKIQLVCLFAGSIVPAGITLYRIPNIIERQGVQQYRSLWASIEILLATGVANSLVLGSFVRDRGIKKTKWKFGSMTDSMERTTSRRGTVVRHWGSDEDLVRDLGLGVEPELRGEESSTVRPAPVAVIANSPPSKTTVDRNWRFPKSDGESEESDVLKYPEPARGPGDTTTNLVPKRKVSFFDVGGLLERIDSGSHDVDMASLVPSQTSESNMSATTTRKTSLFLHDVGGLLSHSPRYNRGNTMELQNIPPDRTPRPERKNMVLQDPGGLLK